jgi:cbb3-type cytochrome oxidase maturation protein
MAMMIGVSTILGLIALSALLWGLKTGQFDDQNKFIDSRFDGNEELQDAIRMEEKKRKAIEKKRESEYRPPD